MTALSQTNSPPPHSLEEDFRLLKAQAMPEQRKPLAVSFSPDGSRITSATEVSEADLAVDATLKDTARGRPNYGWLSGD